MSNGPHQKSGRYSVIKGLYRFFEPLLWTPDLSYDFMKRIAGGARCEPGPGFRKGPGEGAAHCIIAGSRVFLSAGP